MGIELSVAGQQEYGEIERAVTEFAGGSNGGLIVTASFRRESSRVLYSKRPRRSQWSCRSWVIRSEMASLPALGILR
jgi:hypothetical protein